MSRDGRLVSFHDCGAIYEVLGFRLVADYEGCVVTLTPPRGRTMRGPQLLPRRPAAVWAATLVISLQCAWFVGGCVLRLVQEVFWISDEWYGHLHLAHMNDF